MKKELIFIIIMTLIIVISSLFVIYKLSATGQIIDTNSHGGGLKNEEPESEESPDFEIGFVSKIIDGDTIIADGKSVRLLGVDADEKGYECYGEAKKWLENKTLNKDVKLVRDGENKDQYDRYLRYVFVNNENINLKLAEEGLAVARLYPDNKKYSEEILDAEKNARKNKKGCKWMDYDYEQEEGVRLGNEEYSELSERVVGEGIIGACNSGKYIGEEKIIEGEVADVYKSSSGTVFLNFEKPYPNQCFTGVIFKSFLNKFPDYESYENKRVRIKGKIEEYKGKPEIILEKKEQIEIV